MQQNRAALVQEQEENDEESRRVAEVEARRSQEMQLANRLKVVEHAQSHQIADLIQDRDETIDNVAKYMTDVASVIGDIRAQTRL